jgi:hypothetical protein
METPTQLTVWYESDEDCTLIDDEEYLKWDGNNTIVILTSLTSDASRVLSLSHNDPFRLGQCTEGQSRISSRKRSSVSPAGLSTDSGRDREHTPQTTSDPNVSIRWTFADVLHHPKGLVFGSSADPTRCDIRLHEEESIGGISRQHFYIQYNWKSKALTIFDTSSWGTIVKSKVFGVTEVMQNSLPFDHRR